MGISVTSDDKGNFHLDKKKLVESKDFTLPVSHFFPTLTLAFFNACSNVLQVS